MSALSSLPAVPQQVLDTREAVASHNLRAEAEADLRTSIATRKAELLKIEAVLIVADLQRTRALLRQQAPRGLRVAETAQLGRLVCEGIEALEKQPRKLYDVAELVSTIDSAGYEADEADGRVSVDLGDAENVMWFGFQIAAHAPQLAAAIIGTANFDAATNVLWWDTARLARAV